MEDARRMERFAERLDALGPDFSRWPSAEAREAADLVAHAPEAARLHAAALRLSELVAEAAESEVPNGFAFRVMADVEARRADKLGWLFESPRRFALAGASFCVAALAIGVAIGAVTVPAQADDVDDLASPLISLDADL